VFQPATAKLVAPATAIGRPHAEDVATASRTATLHQVRKGTVMAPPPIPSSDDSVPMPPPQPMSPGVPGNWRCAPGWPASASRMEISTRNPPKTIARVRVGR